MSRAEEFWGAADLSKMFPNERNQASVPWPQREGQSAAGGTDKEALSHELSLPYTGRLHSLDPRNLQATQPWVWRGGVSHYLGEQFERTGRTYVDQTDPRNQHPVVYRHDGANVLVNGHHRAAAALLRGRRLEVRVVPRPTLGWGQLGRM